MKYGALAGALALFSLCGAASMNAGADDGAMRKNWFDDPFFQVRDGIANCPKPLGPLLTEAEMNSEAHSRVERGTSCWMAGKCSEPNAYRYDAAIGKAVAERFRAESGFRDASLWITVKRRFVWVEGCVAHSEQAQELERFALSVPDVERAIVNVRTGTEGKPPYPVLSPETW
jgi:hypothetical protein